MPDNININITEKEGIFTGSARISCSRRGDSRSGDIARRSCGGSKPKFRLCEALARGWWSCCRLRSRRSRCVCAVRYGQWSGRSWWRPPLMQFPCPADSFMHAPIRLRPNPSPPSQSATLPVPPAHQPREHGPPSRNSGFDSSHDLRAQPNGGDLHTSALLPRRGAADLPAGYRRRCR
jgi:hypothetical protein